MSAEYYELLKQAFTVRLRDLNLQNENLENNSCWRRSKAQKRLYLNCKIKQVTNILENIELNLKIMKHLGKH